MNHVESGNFYEILISTEWVGLEDPDSETISWLPMNFNCILIRFFRQAGRDELTLIGNLFPLVT